MKAILAFLTISMLTMVTRAEGKKEELHIGAFLTNLDEDVHCFKSAMEAAMALINEDDTLLPNHQLIIHFIDSYGTAGFGISQFFKLRQQKPILQVLLGPFNEQNAAPIRQLAQTLKLPQFEDADETHENRRKALLKLFHHFGWQNIAILYDYEHYNFIESAERLHEDIAKAGLTTTSFQGYSSRPQANIYEQLHKLKKEDSRIISVDMDNYAAPMIFCDAYLNNMSSSKNVFISGNVGLNNDFWHFDYIDDRCTPEQVGDTADGFISLARSNFRLDDKLSRSRKTKEDIWDLIKHFKRITVRDYYVKNDIPIDSQRRLNDEDFYEGSTRMFDMVYRVAVAMDNLLSTQDSKEILMDTYHDEKKYNRISQALKNVEFEGITGLHHRSKTNNGGSERDYIIRQYKNGKFYQVGHFKSITEKLVIYDDRQVFPDGIPKDKLEIKLHKATFRPALVHSMWSLAITGIVLASIFFYINNRYRHKRVVKMSSPNINNCIIIGCVLCYITVIFFGMDSRYIPAKRIGKMCNVILVTFSTGFTLSFGALFSKTWRVYKIFSAARSNKKMVLRDYHLYGMIALLLTIDIVIMTVFMVVSPYLQKQTTLSEKLDINHDVLKVSILYQCDCQHRVPFIYTIMSYKVVVLLFGLFMAWETRNVNIPVLNDARYIGIAVYIVAVISTIGAISSSALISSLKFEENYFVITICICLATTTTLLLVFLPKLTLLFDKNREKRIRNVSSSSTSSSNQHELKQSKTTTMTNNVTNNANEKGPAIMLTCHKWSGEISKDPCYV